MRAVWAFARMTVRSLLRRRTVWGILIVVLLGLIAIGQVPSFNVQTEGRFVLEFGLFGLEMGALLMALGLAVNLYPRDRESGTILPLVAVPISRGQYLMGRFLGSALVQIVALLVGCLGLMVILILNDLSIPPTLLPGTLLLLVEGLFLLAVVFFFSFWTSPPLNVPLTAALFVLAQMSVREFVGLFPQAPSLMRLLRLLLPHMDVFHVKDPIAHGEPVPLLYFLLACLYGLAYTSFMLSVALTVFRERDL